MGEPLVSVIVITYNHSDFISQCLDSILLQETNFPFEIILGEDESFDGTRHKCIEYATEYPDKIRLFLRSRNDCIYISGIPTGIFNFKECLKEARGNYIAICEGDDYWNDPQKLQKQVDYLKYNPDYNICFHDAIVKYAGHKRSDVLFSNLSGNRLDKDILVYTMDDLISEEPLIPTASILFRCNGPINFPDWFDGIINSDMALFILVCGTGKIRFFNESWSVYRKHQGGVSNLIHGKFKHSMRLRMFFKLMKHFNGIYRESFKKMIRYHFDKLNGFGNLYLHEHLSIFLLVPVYYLQKLFSMVHSKL